MRRSEALQGLRMTKFRSALDRSAQPIEGDVVAGCRAPVMSGRGIARSVGWSADALAASAARRAAMGPMISAASARGTSASPSQASSRACAARRRARPCAWQAQLVRWRPPGTAQGPAHSPLPGPPERARTPGSRRRADQLRMVSRSTLSRRPEPQYPPQVSPLHSR
jgi:hypothetical protein